MFSRHVDKHNIDQWEPSTYTTYQAINISNRYFTYRSDDPHAPSVPLGRHVDPTGRLATLAGHDLFHGEDNIVLYRTKPKGSKQ
jgi:hypothetical protein